jgi:hypothetical protein
MPDASIQALVSQLRAIYGDDALSFSVSPDSDGHHLSFRLKKVPASFSVLTLDGSLPFGVYDVQIEGEPPGDYVLAEELSLEDLVAVVARFAAGEWPA